ncbi:MAG: YgaP family membrane protein [Sphingobacteriaceae bacterium]
MMITEEINKITDTLKDCFLLENENSNVSKSERIISLATGTFILFKGITNVFSHPLLALGEVAVGAALLYRGSTGYCPLKAALEDSDEYDEPFTVVEQYIVKPL